MLGKFDLTSKAKGHKKRQQKRKEEKVEQISLNEKKAKRKTEEKKSKSASSWVFASGGDVAVMTAMTLLSPRPPSPCFCLAFGSVLFFFSLPIYP
jgi:hypothetical protein